MLRLVFNVVPEPLTLLGPVLRPIGKVLQGAGAEASANPVDPRAFVPDGARAGKRAIALLSAHRLIPAARLGRGSPLRSY